MDAVVAAIVKEIFLRKDYLKFNNVIPEIETIYFGGGTPSLLNANQLNSIFEAIHKYYKVASNTEITLEANPDDLSQNKLTELKQTPINRLSIGVQSFFEDDLKFMNRAHDVSMALQSVKDAAAAGFQNITIDLIYGIPGMSNEKWLANLNTAFDLPVQHLSCYSLTVEKHTKLDKMIREGKSAPLNDETSTSHFNLLMQQATMHNFEHYEISNFAKAGYYSRHNSSYWQDKPYIGIGPSAHSYNGVSRQWNISSNSGYVAAINEGVIPAETEILTKENRYNEYLMTRLRTKWGVDSNYIREVFGEAFENNFSMQMEPFIRSGDLLLSNGIYSLSGKGKLIADRIASSGFIV